MKKLFCLSILMILMFGIAYSMQVDFKLASQVTSIFPKTEVFEVDDSISLEFGFQLKNYSEIKECILMLNNSKGFMISVPTSRVSMYETNVISYSIGFGNYTWKISCIDIRNQTSTSEERFLEIRQKQEKIKSHTKFLVIMTFLTLILVTIIAIFTSKSVKIYFEERRKAIAKKKLRNKLEQLKEKKDTGEFEGY